MKCKICSKEIPDDSEFCQFCGNKIPVIPTAEMNQKQLKALKKWKTLSFLFLTLFVVSTGAAGFLGYCYYQEQNATAECEKRLDEEKRNHASEANSEETEALREENNRLVKANRSLKSCIEEKEESIENWRSKYYSISGCAEFMKEYVVIVGADEYYYHKYGCRYLNESTFYVYNVDNAIANGYVPCSHCN